MCLFQTSFPYFLTFKYGGGDVGSDDDDDDDI